MHIKKPFFIYNDGTGQLEPAVAEELHTERRQVERFDHISASGKKLSYEIGARDLFEVTFRWQSDALKVEWVTFWEAVRDGSTFIYMVDDSVHRIGDGSLIGDGDLIGDDVDGNAVTTTEYTLENIELPLFEEEIYGYWGVGPLVMREVV